MSDDSVGELRPLKLAAVDSPNVTHILEVEERVDTPPGTVWIGDEYIALGLMWVLHPEGDPNMEVLVAISARPRQRDST